jgi:hypothetical protein
MSEADLVAIETLIDSADKTIGTHWTGCHTSHKLCAMRAMVQKIRDLKKTIANTAKVMLEGHAPTTEEWREWGRKYSD